MLSRYPSNVIRWFLGGGLALASVAANAAIYTYQGANYTTISGSPGLTTAMTVTGTFDYTPGRLGNSVSNASLIGQLTA